MAALKTVLCVLFAGACLSARADSDCYPGVAPTAAKPSISYPADEPYTAWRTWGGGLYWYCLDPATGKWSTRYSITVFADLVPMLASGDTADLLLKRLQDQFRTTPTADARRQLILDTVARYSQTSWQSCTNAVANHLAPYEGYCVDIAAVACGPGEPGQRCPNMPADLPPPGPDLWKVKPSGTSTTRVVYTVKMVGTQYVRGPLTSPTKTVPIGTVCDQSIRVDEPLGPLLTTYMGVPGGIAVCAKQ